MLRFGRTGSGLGGVRMQDLRESLVSWKVVQGVGVGGLRVRSMVGGLVRSLDGGFGIALGISSCAVGFWGLVGMARIG